MIGAQEVARSFKKVGDPCFTVIALLMQAGTRLRWRNAMFQKRRFRIVRSDFLNLPVLSLLCALAKHLKMRTQRSEAMCASVLIAFKTPVYQKNLSS